MTVKNAFEMLIEILNRARTQFVEHTTNLHSVTRMRISPILGSDQDAFISFPDFADIWRIVMPVAQQKP